MMFIGAVAAFILSIYPFGDVLLPRRKWRELSRIFWYKQNLKPAKRKKLRRRVLEAFELNRRAWNEKSYELLLTLQRIRLP